jgi:hypothetical protein
VGSQAVLIIDAVPKSATHPMVAARFRFAPDSAMPQRASFYRRTAAGGVQAPVNAPIELAFPHGRAAGGIGLLRSFQVRDGEELIHATFTTVEGIPAGDVFRWQPTAEPPRTN